MASLSTPFMINRSTSRFQSNNRRSRITDAEKNIELLLELDISSSCSSVFDDEDAETSISSLNTQDFSNKLVPYDGQPCRPSLYATLFPNSFLHKIYPYKSKVHIHDLDEYSLDHIFSLLLVPDQLRCMRTCRRWRSILQRSSHRIQELSLSTLGCLAVIELSSVVSEGRSLPTRAVLSTPADHFSEMLRHHSLFSQLRILILNATQVRRELSLNLSPLKNLKQLEIHGSAYHFQPNCTPLHNVRDMYLEELRANTLIQTPALETLTLNALVDLECAPYSPMPTVLVCTVPKLTRVYLIHVNQFYSMSSEQHALHALAASTPALRSLSLNILQVHEPRSSLADLLERRWPLLQSLRLMFDLSMFCTGSVCTYVRALLVRLRHTRPELRVHMRLIYAHSLPSAMHVHAQLHALASDCPNLREVTVNGHDAVNSSSLPHLVPFMGVHTLYAAANDFRLLKDCPPAYLSHVRTLCVERNCPNTDGFAQLVQRLPALRELYFECSPKTDLLRSLSGLVPNLHFLAIEYAPSTLDLCYMVDFVELRSIYVRGSRRGSAYGMLELLRSQAFLTHIDVNGDMVGNGKEVLKILFERAALHPQVFHHLHVHEPNKEWILPNTSVPFNLCITTD